MSEIKEKDEMKSTKEKEVVETNEKSLFSRVIGAIAFLLFGISVIAVFILMNSMANEKGDGIEKYTPKKEISLNIITALDNGADLRSIKNIYKNRPQKLKKIFDYFFFESQQYYKSNGLSNSLS